MLQFRVAMDTKSITCKGQPNLEVSLTNLLHFPFQKGCHFDLLIACYPEHFNVSGNKSKLSYFQIEYPRLCCDLLGFFPCEGEENLLGGDGGSMCIRSYTF